MTDTIPQTDYNDYNHHDDLRAQVLRTIEAAIDISSAHDLSTLSQRKTKVGGEGTNGASRRSSTPSDLTSIISHHREPEGMNVKSISIRH